MRDVVEENTADSVGLEDLLAGGELGNTEEIIFLLIDQRDKGIESAGLILQRP